VKTDEAYFFYFEVNISKREFDSTKLDAYLATASVKPCMPQKHPASKTLTKPMRLNKLGLAN
jgi:hypothetical protein